MSQAATPSTPAPTASAPRPQQGGGAKPRQAGPTIDPIRVLRQHYKLLAASAVAGAVLGTIANFAQLYLYPVWTGRVVFEVKPDIKDPTRATAGEFVNDESVARTGQTESQRLTSKPVLEAAMKAPDIDATSWGKAYPNVDDRVEELEKTLRAGHMRGTLYFALSWSTQDRSDIPVVLNRVANTYLDQRRTEGDMIFAGDLSGYQDQIRTLDEDIRKQGDEIQRFISNKNVTDATHAHQELRNTIENTARLREEAMQDLTRARSMSAIVERKLDSGVFEDSDRREAADTYSMMQLEQAVHAITVSLNSKSQRFGPDHPEIRALKNQQQAAQDKYDVALREMMVRNMSAAKRNLDDRVKSMDAVVQQQTEALTEADRKLRDLTQSVTELEALKERVKSLEAKRTEFQALSTQLESLKVREGKQQVRMRQPAATPREMTFPRLEYYVPLGAVLGLGISTGIVFLREFLDQRVRQPTDLLGMPGCRFLGVVPDLTDDPTKPETADRVVRTHPNSVTAEMFRQVASRARKALDTGAHKTIAVVAAHPGAGTTTLVTNLASSAAAAGRKVAVVDANFRRPRLAGAFGADAEAPGLGNLLNGQEAPPQMVDGIAVIGPGPASVRVFERLQGDGMKQILATLRSQYDLVLIDLPPTLVAGESLVIVHDSDACILVVRAMQDQRGLIGKTVGQLLDTRSTLLGSVLMRPLHTAGGYFKKNAEIMAEYAQEQKQSA